MAQGGANLSGGQKQRLAIARAVCRKPEIYIFDDSFSALDYRTDRALRQTLKRETAGVTSLIVAQRIGTIRDADRILVLDERQGGGPGYPPGAAGILRGLPADRPVSAVKGGIGTCITPI